MLFLLFFDTVDIQKLFSFSIQYAYRYIPIHIHVIRSTLMLRCGKYSIQRFFVSFLISNNFFLSLLFSLCVNADAECLFLLSFFAFYLPFIPFCLFLCVCCVHLRQSFVVFPLSSCVQSIFLNFLLVLFKLFSLAFFGAVGLPFFACFFSFLYT